MAKGLKALYLLQVQCQRKLERVRRKLKRLDRGESPSSEDSTLEELGEEGKVKKEISSSSSDEDVGNKSAGASAAKVELPEVVKGSGEVAVSKEGGKQDVVGEEVKTNVKQEKVEKGVGGADPCDTMATLQAMRQKSPNYYTKGRDEEGMMVFKCRRCHNTLSTTSHSWDIFFAELSVVS